MKFTKQELEQEATKFLKETFGMKLLIPIVISNRMKSSLGLFRYYRDTKQPIDIRISKNLLENYSEEDILGTLKHECVHYALFMMGKPHRDGDFWFEQVLRLYNIPRTRTKKYKGLGYEYECTRCGKTIVGRSKGQEKRYITKCCNAEMKYLGETLIGMSAQEGK